MQEWLNRKTKKNPQSPLLDPVLGWYHPMQEWLVSKDNEDCTLNSAWSSTCAIVSQAAYIWYQLGIEEPIKFSNFMGELTTKVTCSKGLYSSRDVEMWKASTDQVLFGHVIQLVSCVCEEVILFLQQVHYVLEVMK